MSIQVNVAEAKAKLSELIARAEAGEEVVIARGGKPVVTLATPDRLKPKRRKRMLGVWAHLGLDIPASAFDPDPETLARMEEHWNPEVRDRERAARGESAPLDSPYADLADARRKVRDGC